MKNEKLVCRAASCIAAAVMAIAALGASAGVKDKNVYAPDEGGLSDGYSESDAAASPEGTETRPNAAENPAEGHGHGTSGDVTTAAPNGDDDGTENEPTVETSAADTEKIADGVRDELVIDDPHGSPTPETSTVVIPPETEAPETSPPTTEPPLTELPETGIPSTDAPSTGETTEAPPLTTEPSEPDHAETEPVETAPAEPDPAVTEPVGGEASPEMNEEPE